MMGGSEKSSNTVDRHRINCDIIFHRAIWALRLQAHLLDMWHPSSSMARSSYWLMIVYRIIIYSHIWSKEPGIFWIAQFISNWPCQYPRSPFVQDFVDGLSKKIVSVRGYFINNSTRWAPTSYPFIRPSSWWFQPIWKILVKLDHFPR